MSFYRGAEWFCNDCDFMYPAYGPQYECPACGSENIEIEWEDGEEE